MYLTERLCEPAGSFFGPTVVTMRPILHEEVPRATVITSRYTRAHGAPIHVGNPSALGIGDLDRPDFGQPSTIHRGETPVFWACGVTAQAVAIETRPEIMITHAPGHMLVSDVRNDALIDI
jgi:uncharacterized protein YcsI (UPF0317 family)